MAPGVKEDDKSSKSTEHAPSATQPSLAAPIVKEDDWWVTHWVGVGNPFGKRSSISASHPKTMSALAPCIKEDDWSKSSKSTQEAPSMKEIEPSLARGGVKEDDKSSKSTEEALSATQPSLAAPIIKDDDWWVTHWVGAGNPLGKRWSISASHPTMSSGSSSSAGMSYSTVTTEGRGSAKAKKLQFEADLNKWAESFLKFLNDYKKKGQKCYYAAQVSSLKERGSAKLKINFKHLLEDKKKQDMAFFICNNQTDIKDKMQQVVKDFFTNKGLFVAEPQIKFKNMPKRIYKATEFLMLADRFRFVSLCGGAATTLVATNHGRKTFDAIQSKLLDTLMKGMTWNGKLTLDDILMLVDENGHVVVLITELPVVEENASGVMRAADLCSLWTSLEPFYSLGGQLPLYFEQLKNALVKKPMDGELTSKSLGSTLISNST